MSSPEQALQSSCELLREIMIFKEMQASLWKCMPAYGPAFKLMELMWPWQWYLSNLNSHTLNFVNIYNEFCPDIEQTNIKYGTDASSCNWIQAHVTEYKLMEQHGSFCNCMKAIITACKLLYLNVSFCNCMQAFVIVCKLL